MLRFLRRSRLVPILLLLAMPGGGGALVQSAHPCADKATLLRAIAGLWTRGEGTIQVPPARQVMFVPARPYLPLTTLRAAVTYPDDASYFDDSAVHIVLNRVGLEHLVGNVVALFILGMVCEHAFGRVQFVWLFVMSGVAGSVVSMFTSPGPSVGASGAIFGLQGAAMVLFRRYRDRLLVRDRRIGLVLLVWALFNILQGVASPAIDNGAHIGGLVAGALLARGLHPVVLDPLSDDDRATIRRKGWVAGAIVTVAALAWLVR